MKMVEFEKWVDFWNFCIKTREGYRYFQDDWTINFLQKILKTSKSRVEIIPKGKRLYRAQLGHRDIPIKQPAKKREQKGWVEVGKSPAAYLPERMKPLSDQATEGRVNPKGIPCLYLASTKETAMSEVRPWVGSLISLGQFEVTRDLKILNCSKDKTKEIWFMGKNPTQEEKEILTWTLINHAFSEPVTPDDKIADYCPTQILAELFKKNKFDGVIYRSMLGNKDGNNVALFDLGSAEVKHVSLCTVKNLNYEFEEDKESNGDSYYLLDAKFKKKYRDFITD